MCTLNAETTLASNPLIRRLPRLHDSSSTVIRLVDFLHFGCRWAEICSVNYFSNKALGLWD